MINTSFSRKKLILVILSALFLFFLAGGIYFLFVNNNTKVTTYTFNKYSDVSNWCDITNKGNELKVDCKALLLNISNNDNNSCFDTQVIANDKELENLTVCENGDTLTYTNEVLGYKVLMPIDMVFTYTRESILNDYRFKNVSITKLDDSYVESIVNEDISNLVTIDPSSTTIKNSVDFCPQPMKLPQYITYENISNYSQFYEKNKVTLAAYEFSFGYNELDTNIISMFFACQSSQYLQYMNICNTSKIQNLTSISQSIPRLNVFEKNIVWGGKLDSMDENYLKELSLLYDNMYLTTNYGVTDKYIAKINTLINAINIKENLNENVICATYSIYDALSKKMPIFFNDMNYLKSFVSQNIDKITSPLCGQIITDDDVDKNGLYIKLYYKNASAKDLMSIYSRCVNLDLIIK